MSRFHAAPVVLVAMAAAASAGCTSHSCTDVYFQCDRTTITFQVAGDTWTPGTYTLALSLNGTWSECTLNVPAAPSSAAVIASCPLDAPYTLSLTPVANHVQMVLALQGIPTQLGLDLSVGGKPLLSETIAPQPFTTEPNGEGCGTCTNASATLPVSTG